MAVGVGEKLLLSRSGDDRWAAASPSDCIGGNRLASEWNWYWGRGRYPAQSRAIAPTAPHSRGSLYHLRRLSRTDCASSREASL